MYALLEKISTAHGQRASDLVPAQAFGTSAVVQLNPQSRAAIPDNDRTSYFSTLIAVTEDRHNSLPAQELDSGGKDFLF